MGEEYSGSAINLLNERKGSMLEMSPVSAEGSVNLQFEVPARGMAGVKSKLLSATRGLAVMSSTFAGYKPYAGEFGARDRGNLLSNEVGTVTPFAVGKVQERGQLFAAPGDEVYEDQIIGINAKQGDLKVNVCRAKQLTLEDAVEYVVTGEFVEVTPEAIRM